MWENKYTVLQRTVGIPDFECIGLSRRITARTESSRAEEHLNVGRPEFAAPGHDLHAQALKLPPPPCEGFPLDLLCTTCNGFALVPICTSCDGFAVVLYVFILFGVLYVLHVSASTCCILCTQQTGQYANCELQCKY